MRSVVLILGLLGLCLAADTIIEFTTFDANAVGNMRLNGAAAGANPNNEGVLIITPSSYNVAGSAFLMNSVQISNATFSAAFSFKFDRSGGIGDEDGIGADGMVFIINSVTNNIGSSGGGMGYLGVPNSVGIEYDTYNNGEISGNHVGIDINGDTNSVVNKHYATRLNDGAYKYSWIDYDGTNLEVRIANNGVRPAAAFLSRTMNLASILRSNTVYVGFSAATGSGYNRHLVGTFSFANYFAPIITPIPPPVVPVTTARASVCGNNIVEVGEQCDGGSCCSSSCAFQASSFICRSSAGDCDQAESCTGSSASCPQDSFLASTAVCRASAGDCDQAESCTGSGASCSQDSFLASTTICRASAGDCDVEETCTGSTASCPSDAVQTSTTVCRASAGSCDVEETCTGSSVTCPSDALRSSNTVCRPAVDGCDITESCTGSSASCPTDQLSMTGPCFCQRLPNKEPQPYPEYYCPSGNSTNFYVCLYGAFAPQSAMMTCSAGTTCGCHAGTECSCGATASPCVWANTNQEC